MKFRTFLAAAAIIIFAACETPYRATDNSGIAVPVEMQTAFSAQYPNAGNIVWTNYDPGVVVLNDWELSGWAPVDATDYVVRFNMDNEDYYAWYDLDGTWIGTAYVVKDYTLLPSAVQATLNSQFPAYSIASVNREFQKDRVAYEIVIKKDDTKVVMLVDNEGNIIKQKTKSP
ncbi:MAG: PepSY-like domain-containing protein [Bacteroidota bacterium]